MKAVIFRKSMAALLSAALLVSASQVCSVSAESGKTVEIPAVSESAVSSNSYKSYISEKHDESDSSAEINIDAANFLSGSTTDGVINTDFNGMSGASLINRASDTTNWSFQATQAGLYSFSIVYYPMEGDGSTIIRDLIIDGSLPFDEAENLTFERVWGNEKAEAVYDISGNQIMPFQTENPQWVKKTVCDDSGLTEGMFYLYLSVGQHTLTLKGRRGDMAIHSLNFVSKKNYSSYKETVDEYKQNGYKALSEKDVCVLEGENAVRKSDQTMYPQADRSSPKTQPYNYSCIIYNTIGSSQWKNANQWLEWDFDVENGGLCQIAFHYKQALKSGDVSVRELSIDGQVPFAEAADLTFAYDSAWQLEYLSDSDGNPYEFYLSPGKHTLRLKAVLGKNSETLSMARSCLEELNTIYRKIVVVTGASPDLYRDYKLDAYIPDTLEQIKSVAKKLKELEQIIQKRNEAGSQNTADIKRIYIQLEQMEKDSDTIPKRLKNFKDNVSSFGTWINNAMQQPLEIDYIRIDAPNSKLPNGDAGFFGITAHYFLQFLASFSTDYTTIGQLEEKSNKSITVWMTSGRDQAQILKQLVNSKFTPENDISVDLQLVTVGTLLPAVLAGIGPDVSLGLAQTEPVNMALRGAIMNLSKFKDIDSVCESFYPSSLEPFMFNGDIYALPETLVYPMLFYRKDVIKELGISTDDLSTWEGVLSTVLPRLQNSSLSFGVLPGINNYLMFLYQKGGKLYTENGIKSCLASSEAIDAMKDYTMLYTQYGLSLAYDFANRFRSGELPVAIADFTAYNQLSVFAPEIKNLWGMLPVPGTVGPDGTTHRTSVGTVTGSVILSQTDDPESCWTFTKWWMSQEVQSAYGTLLESVVGSAARYNSANRLSMGGVQWDFDIKESLEAQAADLSSRPEVPGGYYTIRLYDFAFRNIVYNSEDIRETMNSTTDDINREIENKRLEYQLPME